MLLYQNKNKSVIAMTFMNLTNQMFTESQVQFVLSTFNASFKKIKSHGFRNHCSSCLLNRGEVTCNGVKEPLGGWWCFIPRPHRWLPHFAHSVSTHQDVLMHYTLWCYVIT